MLTGQGVSHDILSHYIDHKGNLATTATYDLGLVDPLRLFDGRPIASCRIDAAPPVRIRSRRRGLALTEIKNMRRRVHLERIRPASWSQ